MAADDASDNLIDRWQKANRLSLRCVLVTGGADPGPALAAAGIFDPVAIPVVLGDDPGLSGGMLGDGRTPNLVGTLEFDQPPAVGSPTGAPLRPVQSAADGARPPGPDTTTVPAAFGMRSLAPIRRFTGQSTNEAATVRRTLNPISSARVAESGGKAPSEYPATKQTPRA